MKPALAIPLCLLALVLHGEIIDRIAVSVGNQAITTSDIDREIRVTSFLDHKQPDFTAASRRATADRMVEQRLILRELENSRYPEPSDAEVEPVLDQLKKDAYPAGENYISALTARGITEQDIKNELLWQRRLLLFVAVRFRPGVQVTPEAIHDYFNKVVAPAAQTAHPGQPVNFEDYSGQIEEKLAGEQVDKQMSTWLDSARTRDQVVFHPEAFQ